jgi:hypothetical protein
MLDPDRYFPQDKKWSSSIENRRAGQAFGFIPPLSLRVSVKRLEGGCLPYTLADWRRQSTKLRCAEPDA